MRTCPVDWGTILPIAEGFMADDLIRLSSLLDDAKRFDLIRRQRWPNGVRCRSCDSGHVVRNGWDDARHARQRCNVQQATIVPIIERTVGCGSLVYTDEYDIHARLDTWGYGHKTVCHSSRRVRPR